MTTATENKTRAFTILQRALCLTLECHYLGNTRKVDLKQLSEVLAGDENAENKSTLDEEQFHATKRLINPKALRDVMRTFRKAQNFLRDNAIRSHRIFGERSYLIPLDVVDKCDKALVEIATECAAEAFKLAEVYEAEIEKQRVPLGPTFNRDDYMTPADVRASFSISWDYVNFGAPDKLETVSHAIYERTVNRFEAKMATAFDEVKLVLRQALLQIVHDIAKRLTPGPDGKVKAFHSTVLDDLAEYLSSLKARNIADDQELDAIAEALRKVTKGVDVKTLKDADAVREKVLSVVKVATKKLDKLVVETRGRSISFGDIS